MRALLRRWLNDDLLRTEFGGRYVGTIASVTLENVNNKYAGAHVDEPVIRFADDVEVIPNQKMRRALIEMLGAETNNWIGKRIAIKRQAIERTNKRTGEVKVRFEKRVEDPAADAVSAEPWERESFDGPVTAFRRAH